MTALKLELNCCASKRHSRTFDQGVLANIVDHDKRGIACREQSKLNRQQSLSVLLCLSVKYLDALRTLNKRGSGPCR
jgi:hypothetical protein